MCLFHIKYGMIAHLTRVVTNALYLIPLLISKEHYSTSPLQSLAINEDKKFITNKLFSITADL